MRIVAPVVEIRESETLIAVPLPRGEIARRALALVEPCQVAEFHRRMRERVERARAARRTSWG